MNELEKVARQALEALQTGTQQGAAIDDLLRVLEQPAQQEPVAWIVEDQYGERLEWVADANIGWGNKTEPLYTRPQAREWVGLTEGEMFKLWLTAESEEEDRYAFARAIEAKLREKNNG